MKNFGLVFRLLLKNGFIKRIRTSSRGLKYAQIIVIIFLTFLILGINVGLMYIMPNIIALGKVANFLVLLAVITAFVIVLTGVPSMIITLYLSKDTEFFLGLPIKSSTIYISKLAYLYLIELVLAVIIMLPIASILGIIGKFPFEYFLCIILLIATTPLFPLFVVSILCLPFMYVVGFFKSRGVFTSVAFILIFVIVMLFYYIGLGNINYSNGFLDVNDLLLDIFYNMRYIMYFIPFATAISYISTKSFETIFGLQDSLLRANLINLAVIGVFVIAIILSVYYLAGIVYSSGIKNQLETKKSISIKSNYSTSTIIKTLVSKEFKELLRTPSFSFQCLTGIFLTPIIMWYVAYNLNSDWYVEKLDSVLISSIIKLLLPIGMFMFAFHSPIGGSCFSREGEKFYYIKMLPIDPYVQLKAKLIVGYCVAMMTSLLTSIAFVVATKEYMFGIIVFGFMVIYSYANTNFAAVFDITSPNIKWTVPNEAIKRNKNILIPAAINIGFGVLIMIITIALALVFEFFGIGYQVILSTMVVFLYVLATLFLVFTKHTLKRSVHCCVERIEA